VTARYPTLEDYLHTAAYVLDLPVETVIKATRIELAESALHAPQAGWGDVEFYPHFAMKAAVLLVRLAKNHALPDGNKRTA
jgi:death on curing protein